MYGCLFRISCLGSPPPAHTFNFCECNRRRLNKSSLRGWDSGHSSIHGLGQSKWGACFQQMAASLKCQACWVWCPNSCVREGKLECSTQTHTLALSHTHTHNPVWSCQKRQQSRAKPDTVLSHSKLFIRQRTSSAPTVTSEMRRKQVSFRTRHCL